MRYARVLRQICALGSDAGPPRNSFIRRGASIRKRNQRQRGSLWIRRLKVRILPPQPPPQPSLCGPKLLAEYLWPSQPLGDHESDVLLDSDAVRPRADAMMGACRP